MTAAAAGPLPVDHRNRVELVGPDYREAIARRRFWAGQLRGAKRARTHGARIRAVRLAGEPRVLFGIYIEPHEQ